MAGGDVAGVTQQMEGAVGAWTNLSGPVARPPGRQWKVTAP